MESKEFKLDLGGRELKATIKNLAEKADGEVLVQYGDTLVLATCVMAKQESDNINFFPLSVNYEEKYYAAGKIGGARYIRREGRPSDEAVLTSRLIDRAIRPRFPKNLHREVQVIITCLSWDEENDPGILGLIATSIALSISNIPWEGPIGAIKLGRVNNEFILNPLYQQQEESILDLTLAGIERDNNILTNMVECKSEEVEESMILEGLDFSEEALKKLINFQKEIQKTVGKEKLKLEEFQPPKLKKEIEAWIGNKLKKILSEASSDQNEQLDKLKRELSNFVKEKYEDPKEKRFILEFFDEEIGKIMHESVLQDERRIDGRNLEEIRNIDGEVGLIPRSHGCGLFIRGKTKALSILTLGTPGDHQIIEGMEISGKKRFMHHYNFPPYSAGETRPIRGPGRREIGHGMLGEKALRSLVPDFENFPYTIRVVSEMLCSNGSTSMASISSSSLALMDAGIPIKRPAAGIAIGLITDGKENHKILTDIQGPEDHHGDMDFKVAGTKKGITVLQMDVKIPGITKEIFSEALLRGKKARTEILEKMQMIISEPRSSLSKWAPRVYILQINPEKIGDVIGPGGKIIRKITEKYDVEVDIEEDGKVFVTARKEENGKNALSFIKGITKEVGVGETFEGTVKRVLDFGVFIEILPGKEGLLRSPRFKKPTLKINESVSVKVKEIDSQGRINLSLTKGQE